MAAREFDITIGKDGAVELHCKGLKGSSCLEAVKLFEKMAGEMKSQQPATGFAKGEINGQNPPKNVGSAAQTLL
jgi:hypothetical protein